MRKTLMAATLLALALLCGPADARDVGTPRPRGCPHAFCGCEASLFEFHRIVPRLNLAANWLRFPRALPAPLMAAVRRDGHHVFVLLSHVAGLRWLVRDGNSGHHRTHVHVQSILHYVIVDPHGHYREARRRIVRRAVLYRAHRRHSRHRRAR